MINQPTEKHAGRGFTLIELMITLVIVAILGTTAVTSFASLLSSSALTTSLNTFTAHIQLARSESIKRRHRVVACPSTNQLHCTGGQAWHEGYILFTDANANRTRDDEELILKVVHLESSAVKIYSTPGRKKLTFQPTGMSPGSNSTITFCPINPGIPPKTLITNNSGRPRVSDKKPGGGHPSCP